MTETKQRYYPNRSDFTSHEVYMAHVNTLDQLYALHDRMTKVEERQEKVTTSPNAPSTLNGMNVIGSPSADKSTLQFNASTGELEWVAPTP